MSSFVYKSNKRFFFIASKWYQNSSDKTEDDFWII